MSDDTMTKLDQLAAAALPVAWQTLVKEWNTCYGEKLWDWEPGDAKVLAERAYTIADAMLVESRRKP
jgi:hypothetical protein